MCVCVSVSGMYVNMKIGVLTEPTILIWLRGVSFFFPLPGSILLFH